MSSKVNLFLSAETIVVWVWCRAGSIVQCPLIFWLTLFDDQTLPQHQGTNTSLLNNRFGIHHTTIHGAPIQIACSSVFSTLFHVMWDLKASVLFKRRIILFTGQISIHGITRLASLAYTYLLDSDSSMDSVIRWLNNRVQIVSLSSYFSVGNIM